MECEEIIELVYYLERLEGS